MVDKNVAFNRGNGSSEFAESDPLAELTRIVGYEDRPRHVSPPAAQSAGAQHRSEPNFNLEDELLREFAIYDAPRDEALVPANDAAAPAVDPMHVNDFLQRVEDVFARREPEFEPAPAYQNEPTYHDDFTIAEAPLGDDLRYTMNAQPQDFAADVYADPYAAQAPVAAPAYQDPTYQEPVYQAPVYQEPVLQEPVNEEASYQEPTYVDDPYQQPIDLSYEVEQSVTEEPIYQEAPVYYEEPAYAPLPVEPEPVAPQAATRPAQGARSSLEFSSMRQPLGNFSMSRATPFIPKAGAAATIPVASPQPVAAPQPVTYQAPSPVAAAEPKLDAQSDLDALIADVSRYSIGKPVQPAQYGSVPRQEPVNSTIPAPAQTYAAPIAEPEFDLSDDDFEAALDDMDFEFDLSDVDLSEAARQPVVETVVPTQPARQAAVESVQQAYVAPVQAQSVRADSQAFSAAPVSAAPVYRAPVTPPVPVAAAPVFDQPAQQIQRPVENLPFDLDQIGDIGEQTEAIAEFDVPDLPPQINEPRVVSQRNDDDLDLDTELAALFTPPNSGFERHRGADKPQAASQSERASDVDEFERALEADFRRSLQENPTKPNKISTTPSDHYDDYQVEGDGFDEPNSAKRWMVPAAAAVGALVVLGGLYSVFFSGSSVTSDGQPIVIAADDEPMKVVPENPGGRVVPNQDKAVYDRVAGGAPADPKQPALISSDETPVDVVQHTLIPEQMGIDDDGDFGNEVVASDNALDTVDPRLLPQQSEEAASGETTAESPVNVAPRRVRTMIVRADGTLVTQEVEAPAAPAPVVAAPVQSKPAPTPAPAVVAQAPAPVTPPVVQPAPAPAAQVATPAPAPAPVVAAAPAPAAPAVANTPSSGGFYMQIASLPSEAEAQKTYNSMSAKFGSVIGGRGVDIKRAEVAGKGTYYRVRIPAGDRSEAAALCERFRAAGGSCLVAR
jgi:hypothetical protein